MLKAAALVCSSLRRRWFLADPTYSNRKSLFSQDWPIDTFDQLGHCSKTSIDGISGKIGKGKSSAVARSLLSVDFLQLIRYLLPSTDSLSFKPSFFLRKKYLVCDQGLLQVGVSNKTVMKPAFSLFPPKKNHRFSCSGSRQIHTRRLTHVK